MTALAGPAAARNGAGDLAGRTAMVLGAGGGLGCAVARSLASAGAAVAACDIDTERLGRTLQLIEPVTEALAVPFDLADLQACDDAVTTVERELHPVDILVNITGGPPATAVVGNSAEAWRTHFDRMVLPVIHLTDRVLAGMRARGWGRVITSTSSGVIAPIAHLGMSNALRGVLLGWSKTLANEVGGDNVTCNVVVPGRIATDRIRQLDQARAQREGRPVEDVAAASQAGIPLGRYGDPSEFGEVVAFLASDRASYVHGSVIRIDGGMIPSV